MRRGPGKCRRVTRFRQLLSNMRKVSNSPVVSSFDCVLATTDRRTSPYRSLYTCIYPIPEDLTSGLDSASQLSNVTDDRFGQRCFRNCSCFRVLVYVLTSALVSPRGPRVPLTTSSVTANNARGRAIGSLSPRPHRPERASRFSKTHKHPKIDRQTRQLAVLFWLGK